MIIVGEHLLLFQCTIVVENETVLVGGGEPHDGGGRVNAVVDWDVLIDLILKANSM